MSGKSGDCRYNTSITPLMLTITNVLRTMLQLDNSQNNGANGATKVYRLLSVMPTYQFLMKSKRGTGLASK